MCSRHASQRAGSRRGGEWSGSRLRARALAIALLLAPKGALAKDLFELEGSWFVVAHFTDESTANPEVMRWLDEVWTFEKKGSRLQWTRYPLVVFDDTTGRFESVGRNPRSRVLAAWEPNEAQLKQLMDGPRVNSRGSKMKALRGSPKRGWKSVGRLAIRSATTVGYQENWEISGLDGMPLFSRQDVLGTGATAQAEGLTTFQVTELGERPSGIYERDGVKKGTFFMMRTPPPRGLEEKEGTVNERFEARQRDELQRRWNEEQKRREQAGEPLDDD